MAKDLFGPVLEMRGIHKRFPGVHALKGVDFQLYPGEVHALVGENGAGKSTLIKIISGVHDFDEGEYLFNGAPAHVQNPLDAINKGISVIYQELNLVPSLSVAENIFFGHLPSSKRGRVIWQELYGKTRAALKRVGLDIDPRTKVQYLSVAQQQLVEIARALSHNACILVMDEPTSALSPTEVENLFGVIRQLRNAGVGIIYVSHKLEEIFEIADRITVLRDGEHITTQPKRELDEQQLIALMVGRKITELYPKTAAEIGKPILEVRNLTTDKVFDISFYVRKGEVVGFSGLMGAGRTELARALFGADRRIRGEILLEGVPVPPSSTVEARRRGIGLIPENRKEEGIFPNLCVRKNMTIAALEQISRKGHISEKQETDIVQEQVGALNIVTPSMHQLIPKLSGGNQQKVLVARWLIKENLKVLIVDEPTRGIDVGAKREIYRLIDALAGQGLAVIVMSSEMPEILGICDRIYVMREGRITGEFDRAEATQEKLLAKAIG
jgi:ABC-type sugar transport system ATPase subunit